MEQIRKRKSKNRQRKSVNNQDSECNVTNEGGEHQAKQSVTNIRRNSDVTNSKTHENSTLEKPTSSRKEEITKNRADIEAVFEGNGSAEKIVYQYVNVGQIERISDKGISNETIAMRPFTETQLSAFYSSNELSMAENFTQQFIDAELQGSAIKNHHLYEMLSNYLSIRAKLNENTLEINQLKEEYSDLKNTLWTTSFGHVTGEGQCAHGDKVTASHSFTKCTLNKSAWQSMQRILTQLQQCCLDNHRFLSFSAESFKLQIEIFLQTVIQQCSILTERNKENKITLYIDPEPEQWKPYLSDLRICISVLFVFQRKLIKDKQFIDESRAWLTQLIAVLLRTATYQDHLFILNHILRCPAGVGSWASSFIQMPLSSESDCPFNNYEINHIVTILFLILSPVKEREIFLGDILQPMDEAQEALWVVIDSEGEDDEGTSGSSLRENDLVAFFNQVPLGSLFRALSSTKNGHHMDHITDQITEQDILKFFAFSTLLLKIINKGLSTYNQSRYAQFAKRLCRLILHTLENATDQWEKFCSMHTVHDPAMMKRLQIEYDTFFLRVVYSLYTYQKVGSWQYLSAIPYNSISLETLWKILNFLHSTEIGEEELLAPTNLTDFSTKIKNQEFKDQFVEKVNSLSDGEIYYLLNTFANVALARNEIDLIITATMDLLQIGFINEATQDVCSKTSRILLTHITSKHPCLLSRILKDVKECINQIGDLALYLYEELPIAIWKVNDNDIEIFSRLLNTKSDSQIENKLARMIISRLNWDFHEDGSLFLPYHIHRNIALLVLQAVDEEPAFSNWGWQTILRLKLHINDKGFKDMRMVMDIDNYDILVKGVREKKPLFAFVALLMTSWGHLIPVICSNAFGQLIFLESQQKYEAVLFILYLIMPLFLNSQECIVNCLDFQEILSNLLYVDQSYTSMAKSLIGAQSTVLQQFGNMIETQMKNYHTYDLESPRILVRLWMNSLVSVEQWTKNYGVLYLLDVIIKASFFHKDALEAVTDVLKELIQDTTPQEQGGSISSIFKWVSSTNQNVSLISSSLSPFPWLGYVMIEVEHLEREKKTGLWKELLLQLHSQKGKVNVDAAIKKAASILKINTVSSASLCIYRYAQQALDTSLDHPILVLIWQKFFELFFEQLTVTSSLNRRSIGDKFFEGVVNLSYLKKMKNRLRQTNDYYRNEIVLMEKDESKITNLPFLRSKLSIFTAYELWLEEPRLHMANLFLPSLPPNYENILLEAIFSGKKTPWYPYVDYNRVKKEQQKCIRLWRISNFRETTNVNKPLLDPKGHSQNKDPAERFLKRMESYEIPKFAPAVKVTDCVIPKVDITSVDNMLSMLNNHFTILKKFADNHHRDMSDFNHLNAVYKDMIPNLYKIVYAETSKLAQCRRAGTKTLPDVSSSVLITLKYEESRLDHRIHNLILMNRQEFEYIFDVPSKPVPASLCNSAVALEHTIRILQQQIHFNPSTTELGVELFYFILKSINEKTVGYLPTKTLFVTCLEKLGQSYICGVEFEISRLLDKILTEPNLAEYLAPHFSPGNIGSSNLLSMYKKISKEVGQKYDVSFALLSKFDIDNWLNNRKPKLNQRSKFLELVMKGLSTLGTEPQVEALALHGLYRKHLLSIFQFQFPEHYGEILVNLLRCSCEDSSSSSSPIALSVWIDTLNSLAFPTQIHPKNPLRDQLRAYAQNQRKLNYREILETTELLSSHFTRERLQYGLYGLYPKCEKYLDIYCLLLGMSGHALIISSLNTHQGLESDKLCEKIWPCLRDMYSPWIAPYSMQNLKDYMASWIQQLTDDRTILLPWIPSNVYLAQKMLDSFKECVLFLLHILPACSVILNYVWQWYVTTYAHNSVKEHIFDTIHRTLLVLPWQNFWPSINDLEAMLKIVDQYLPECHQFLGQIFISVQWINWMNQFNDCPIQIKARVYHCYINLLVKLSNEPNIRSQHVEKFNSLLVQSENLNWDVLDPGIFQHVTDWYIMSCDSNVIFRSDPLVLDVRVLQFLKTVAGYEYILERNEDQNMLRKRYMYVRSFVKLISVYASRNKLTVPSKENEICAVINTNMKHMERVVKSKEELNIILSELLNLLNINLIGDICMKCIAEWVSKKSGNDPVIETMLHVTNKAVKNYEFIAKLYELTLECYFQNVNEYYQPTWSQVRQYGRIVVSNQIELEQTLLAKDSILTLNFILLDKISCCSDYQVLLNTCLDWLQKVKMSNSTESKLPLIWLGVLNIALKYCEIDESSAGGLLYKFSLTLLQMAEYKGNSGWGRGLLSVIGINRDDGISLSFRFMCRALGGYILAQLPEMKGKPQIVRRQANAPAKVGQPGGNTECAKILLKLDFGQSQGKLKEYAELALNEIQDPMNSLHNVAEFLILMSNQFSTKSYFRDLGKN